jgi:hypothetical protein
MYLFVVVVVVVVVITAAAAFLDVIIDIDQFVL